MWVGLLGYDFVGVFECFLKFMFVWFVIVMVYYFVWVELDCVSLEICVYGIDDSLVEDFVDMLG